MRTLALRAAAFTAALFFFTHAGRAQPAPEAASQTDLEKRLEAIEKKLDATDFTFEMILKRIDDILWFERVGDVADIDKVYYTSALNPQEEETYGITNERHPFKIWAYVFVPKKLDRDKKAPLLAASSWRRARRLHDLPHAHHPRADGPGVRSRSTGVPWVDRLREGILRGDRLRWARGGRRGRGTRLGRSRICRSSMQAGWGSWAGATAV